MQSEQSVLDGIHFRTELELPGRRWSILFSPAPGFANEHQTMWATLTLVIGLLFSGLLAVFLSNQRRNLVRLTNLSKELTLSRRALSSRAACSQAIIEAEQENALLNRICQILVEIGGYKFAWIGFKEDDSHKRVRPVGEAGFEKGYLATLAITWEDTEWGRGPTGTAIREGRVVMAKDLQSEKTFEPWRHEAIKRGYASSISIPLVLGETILGAINIYSANQNAFNDEEVNLITEHGKRSLLWNPGDKGTGRASTS